MKELDNRLILLGQMGALLMLGGAALFLCLPVVATILFTLGVVAYCPIRMLQRYEGCNFVIRRLRRQQLLGQLAFLCAACCMIMQVGHFGFTSRNEWVICLTIGCILEIYTSFRIPVELKKEEK